METCIVYYSRSNNTRTGAIYLSKKMDVESIELKEKGERGGVIGFVRSGYQAVKGRESKLIGDPWRSIASYSRLYVMTPIWGSHTTPAMNTFLGQADLKGKEVTVITFQAGAKGEGSEKVYEHIRGLVERGGGTFINGIPLHSAPPGKFAGEEHIEGQIDSILSSL